MPYAVELDLDEATSATIEAIAARVTRECPDVATISSIRATPHMSLAIYDDLDLERIPADLCLFAAGLSAFDLRIGSIGLFPAELPGVVFLAPVVSHALLDLHRRYHDLLTRYQPTCWHYYRPGNWVPHITIAMDIPARTLPDVIRTCIDQWTPTMCRVVGLRLVSVRPVTTIARWPFVDWSCLP